MRKYFEGNKNSNTHVEAPYVQTTLRNNSIFNPPTSGNQCLEAFQKMVEDDLRKLEKQKNHRARNVWNTIKSLGKRKEVVIRPADKGGGLVILNKSDYEEEMENLLRVENTYSKLKKNPKRIYEKKLKMYVKKGKDLGILNKKEAEYLVSNSTKTPVIY